MRGWAWRTISQHLPGEPDYALANGRMFQMVRAALERTGVRLMDIELARVADGVDVMSYEKEFALGGRAGGEIRYRQRVECGPGLLPGAVREDVRSGGQIRHEAQSGVRPLLKHPRPDRSPGLDGLMDRPNVQVLVDTLHAHRVKVTPEQLREVAAERFGFVHLCDGPAFIPPVDHPDMVGVAGADGCTWERAASTWRGC